MSQNLIHLLPGDIVMVTPQDMSSETIESFLKMQYYILTTKLYALHPNYKQDGENPFPAKQSTRPKVQIVIDLTSTDLTNMDESYKLDLKDHKVTIIAQTYFGIRHGFETLSQLIEYDEMTDALIMHEVASIKDAPKYSHRGILIDTARNYISVPIMKRVIDAMSYNKLNVLHWHITDTHSFPLGKNAIFFYLISSINGVD